jgi:hypothetical protein
MPGIAPAPSDARAAAYRAARRAWHGLIQVLIGSDPAPVWRWRSPRERQAAYAVLVLATLALCVLNVSTVHGVSSLHASTSPGVL